MSNVKNHTKQGGDVTVIDGKLILHGREIQAAAPLADSDASTIAELKADFNQLLTRLRQAGLMEA